MPPGSVDCCFTTTSNRCQNGSTVAGEERDIEPRNPEIALRAPTLAARVALVLVPDHVALPQLERVRVVCLVHEPGASDDEREAATTVITSASIQNDEEFNARARAR